jgi:hypothetical protein
VVASNAMGFASLNPFYALHIVRKGLILDHDDAGEPIMAVAWMAAERLQAVKATWKKALAEKRR